MRVEDKHQTNPQPAASRGRRGYRLLLNLFLFFPFPLDCFWIFNAPVCCLKKDRKGSSTKRKRHQLKVFSFLNFTRVLKANKHAFIIRTQSFKGANETKKKPNESQSAEGRFAASQVNPDRGWSPKQKRDSGLAFGCSCLLNAGSELSGCLGCKQWLGVGRWWLRHEPIQRIHQAGRREGVCSAPCLLTWLQL